MAFSYNINTQAFFACFREAYMGKLKYLAALAAFFLVFTTACGAGSESVLNKDYGVFLSIDTDEMDKLSGYKTAVIDAQYFSAQDIETLHENGTTVYTYLNIGSLENFRPYYQEYEELTIGDYVNWEEERWVDVSSAKWQQFMEELALSLAKKGVDGFFIDNCDIYYYKPDEEIFSGLTAILKNIKSLGKDVIINGGSEYITLYRDTYGSAKDIMSAVNQEEVFSRFNFDTSSMEINPDEEKAYFSAYIESCKADGMEVYLIEYTDNSKLIEQIKAYCSENGFHYYITDSIELD